MIEYFIVNLTLGAERAKKSESGFYLDKRVFVIPKLEEEQKILNKLRRSKKSARRETELRCWEKAPRAWFLY